MNLIPIKARCGCVGFKIEGQDKMLVVKNCDTGPEDSPNDLGFSIRTMDKPQFLYEVLSDEQCTLLFDAIAWRLGLGNRAESLISQLHRLLNFNLGRSRLPF